jgi:hypothetical protein
MGTAKRDASFDNLIDRGREIETWERKDLHPFVSGHLFASKLKQELETTYPDTHFTWGQVEKKGELSGEIDIIAYRGKPVRSWEDACFAIINKKDVIFIIEAKMRTCWKIKDLREQCRKLSKYSKNAILVVYQVRVRTEETVAKRENDAKNKAQFREAVHLTRLDPKSGKQHLRSQNWDQLKKTISGLLSHANRDVH